MGWAQGVVYPDLEEAWWALGLVVTVHALRVGAWALGDEDVRLLALEALACAEMLGVGPVLSPARARAAGAQGVATYVAIVLLIRLYRSRYWIWHETGNPASSLASMPPDQKWVEFALVKTWAQFTGGWIGYRYITWFSPVRTETLKCSLPVRLSVVHSAAVEAAGTFFVEVVSRGLTPTHQCVHALHHWATFLAKYAVYVSVKLLAVNLTGSIFNPMTATVTHHVCFLERKYVSRLVFVYLICPCLGASLAAKVAPSVKNFSHTFHECFGNVMNSEPDRDL